jgi:hypothetical protein
MEESNYKAFADAFFKRTCDMTTFEDRETW